MPSTANTARESRAVTFEDHDAEHKQEESTNKIRIEQGIRLTLAQVSSHELLSGTQDSNHELPSGTQDSIHELPSRTQDRNHKLPSGTQDSIHELHNETRNTKL